MPYLQIQTSAQFDKKNAQQICAQASAIIAESLGKPETYVMVSIQPAEMIMSGKADPAAFADLRSIGGLDADKNRELSQALCSLLEDKLGLSGERIYLNFQNVERHNWGFNASTFG